MKQALELSRFFVIAILATSCLAYESVIIEVPGYAKAVQGDYGLLGTAWYDSHRKFYSFRTLYYASKPTNATRFLPAETNNYPYPDDEIINAAYLPPGCAQGGDNSREDCLILSVYSPCLPTGALYENTTCQKQLPVMVWIHGGSFDSGQSLIYEPNTFLTYDVVVVVIQYRLGVLGFLSLDVDEIPGNAGMFDQIEALRWVNKFIQYFGGDPNCVTIVGESAGAASVGFLMLAPQARGLFHRAIAESGSMLADWALDRKARQSGLRIAELAGCPLEPQEALVHCLRNKDYRTLERAQGTYSNEDEKNGGLGFGGQSPVIQVAGAQRALTEEPRALIDAGNYSVEVPIMFGANSDEGVYALDMMLRGYIRPNGLEDSEEFWKYDSVSVILRALGVEDPTGAIGNALTTKYLGYAVEAGQMGNKTAMIPGLIDLTGTLFLKAGGWETVVLHSKYNPHAYWYSFEFYSKFSLLSVDKILGRGVLHADEIMYLFTMPFPHNETERTLSRRMVDVWKTFAEHGNPTPDGVQMWEGIPKFKAYTDAQKEYMSIDRHWTVRHDYTEWYTNRVDALKPKRNMPHAEKRSEAMMRYLQEKREYQQRKKR